MTVPPATGVAADISMLIHSLPDRQSAVVVHTSRKATQVSALARVLSAILNRLGVTWNVLLSLQSEAALQASAIRGAPPPPERK